MYKLPNLKQIMDKLRMNKQPILQSVMIGAFLAAAWNTAAPHPNATAAVGNISGATAAEVSVVSDPFASVVIQAKSFLVFDLSSGEPRMIAERNSALQWPLASIAKLMTAVVARENIYPDEPITITRMAIAEYGDDGFLTGERFGRDDLVDLMLVRSSNDAARAIADHLGYEKFLELMNARAAALGMSQTYFANPNGLDFSASASGAYGSAQDLAKLSVYILKADPRIFAATEAEEFSVRSLSGRAHGYMNTNKLTNVLPQLIGGKTGFTDIAGGNLLMILDLGVNHPIGIIVLGSTESGRFDDVLALYEATLEYFKN